MRKERPILFSTAMVRALLDGRKGMTRRLVKDKHVLYQLDVNNHVPSFYNNSDFCPYGQVGDILWVRETFSWDWKDYSERTEKYYYYKASTSDEYLASGEKWQPSIFMPKEACRIRLEITNVRVERLQDISQEDAKAEGLYPAPHRCPGWKNELLSFTDCYKCAFKILWNSINGKKGHQWNKNEWVWVIEFRKI